MTKQYLIMADEVHMAVIGKMMPGIRFVEVQGINIDSQPNHTFLVNPKPVAEDKPVEPTHIEGTPAAPEENHAEPLQESAT